MGRHFVGFLLRCVVCTCHIILSLSLAYWLLGVISCIRWLQEDLKAYCLRIYEDGDVDMEFPPLDVKESIVKFDFPSLAFMEVNALTIPKKPSIVVTV